MEKETGIELLRAALAESGIDLKSGWNSVTLTFANGDYFEFSATGAEGSRLVMEASVKVTGIIEFR